MEQRTKRPQKRRREKWAEAAGDHAVLSARGNEGAGKYLTDLDTEMSDEIRIKPTAPGQKLKSVKPSCCAPKEKLFQQAGEMEFSTGKLQVGADPKKRQLLFSFVRHENDAEGREVQENRAQSFAVGGRDCFRSNDASFTEGAMALRCDAAKASKRVEKQFRRASEQEGGDSTLDRVLPFQKQRQERQRLESLKAAQGKSMTDRTSIHTAMSGVRSLSLKKRQKDLEFGQKFYRVAKKAKADIRPDDSLLYIRKKWERLLMLGILTEGQPPPGRSRESADFTPETPVENKEQVYEQIQDERAQDERMKNEAERS